MFLALLAAGGKQPSTLSTSTPQQSVSAGTPS
jgi:hypothetical protein